MVTLTHDPDWDLVRQCKRGDQDAFGQLVRRHQHSVFKFCMRMLKNAEDAEDITQEAFVQAYRNIGKFRPKAKFSTWLFTIARNLALNLIRDEKRGKRRMVSIDDEQNGVTLATNRSERPDSEAIDDETSAVVRAAIDRLSTDHRLVMLLRDVEGLSYKEIGQVTACRPGTVKSRLARARANLKEALLNELDRGDLI